MWLAVRVAQLEAEIKDLHLQNEVLIEENTRLLASVQAQIFPRLRLSPGFSQDKT
jgi:hypothetical protein